MDKVLQIVELILACLGIYYIILRIIARILYIKIKSNKKEALSSYKQTPPSPKYIVMETCPICGSTIVDIFENYDVNKEGEKFLVGYSIGCLHCGLRSPILNSMEQCIDYWNTRNYKNKEEWVAGEPEIVYKEVKNGEKESQILSTEQTNYESAHVENDNL